MQKQQISVLLVDDEPSIRRVLRNSLQAAGYLIEEAPSGEGALTIMRQRRFNMVLLDISMPGIGGMETCRRIRDLAPKTAIVMISVREKEDDKVLAFETGADDYITKPFRFRELLARMRAVRRRTETGDDSTPEILHAGRLELDVTNRMLRRDSREVRLSRREFDILAFLMKHPDVTIPHARLLQAVWGPEYGNETEYLRTYVRLLRKKIESDAAQPEYILTEPWIGYRFRGPQISERQEALATSAGE